MIILNERPQASLSTEDQNALSNINNISNWNTFNSKYLILFNVIRAKCLGRNADSELKNQLNNLKSRITDAGPNKMILIQSLITFIEWLMDKYVMFLLQLLHRI